jgi:single-strand DNA-binding protein
VASYNKVLLMGNLTRDPEMRVTPGGLSICKFSIAVNRKFKTQDGQEKEEVTFVDIDSFGKQAEIISKFFGKGKPIFVEGRLKLDQWDDKTTGAKRSKLGVVLDNFQFIDGPRGSGEGGGAPGGANPDDHAPAARPAPPRAGSSAPATRLPPPADHIDEDVPF